MNSTLRTSRSLAPVALLGLAVTLPLGIEPERHDGAWPPAVSQSAETWSQSVGRAMAAAAEQICGLHAAVIPGDFSVSLVDVKPLPCTPTGVDELRPPDHAALPRLIDLPPPVC